MRDCALEEGRTEGKGTVGRDVGGVVEGGVCGFGEP
jgi:hypothetical protein